MAIGMETMANVALRYLNESRSRGVGKGNRARSSRRDCQSRRCVLRPCVRRHIARTLSPRTPNDSVASLSRTLNRRHDRYSSVLDQHSISLTQRVRRIAMSVVEEVRRRQRDVCRGI